MMWKSERDHTNFLELCLEKEAQSQAGNEYGRE